MELTPTFRSHYKKYRKRGDGKNIVGPSHKRDGDARNIAIKIGRRIIGEGGAHCRMSSDFVQIKNKAGPPLSHTYDDSRIIAGARRVRYSESEKSNAHLGDFSSSKEFLNCLLPGFALCRVDIARTYGSDQ